MVNIVNAAGTVSAAGTTCEKAIIEFRNTTPKKIKSTQQVRSTDVIKLILGIKWDENLINLSSWMQIHMARVACKKGWVSCTLSGREAFLAYKKREGWATVSRRGVFPALGAGCRIWEGRLFHLCVTGVFHQLPVIVVADLLAEQRVAVHRFVAHHGADVPVEV